MKISFFLNLYHILKKTIKESRFIAGYSMGGGASIVYGLSHPDKFSSVYSMSGYLRRQYLEFLKDDPSAEWRQQLVEDHNPIRTVNEISDGRVDAWKGVDWFIRPTLHWYRHFAIKK